MAIPNTIELAAVIKWELFIGFGNGKGRPVALK